MSKSLHAARFLLGTLVLCLALSPALLPAQSAGGSISGSVTDQGGAPLPGVSLTAKETKTSATRITVTNANGGFNFPLLPVGTYDVSADLSGFASVKRSGVVVNVGGDVALKITMALSGVATAVT